MIYKVLCSKQPTWLTRKVFNEGGPFKYREKVQQGGATLQLSCTTKPNQYAPILFFMLNAYIFAQKGLRLHLNVYAPDFPKIMSK